MLKPAPMADGSGRRVRLEIPWSTVLKVLAAAALVWAVLRLIQIILLLVVAVLLAVALDPVVEWLQRRNLSRGAATGLVSLALVVLVGGFVWTTWSSLREQSQYLAQHLTTVEKQASGALPAWVHDALGLNNTNVSSAVSGYALGIAQSAVSAITLIVFGFVLMIYFLIDGRRTYEWIVAFIPRSQRAKARTTASECRQVIFGYVVGNAITSIIAAVCTWVALSALGVPAALLLAILAGLSDFVPVIGFIVSAIPAVLLALTVSANTALLVVVFYILYNTVETYLLSPWAYGNRMRLSDMAVILAFAVGAQLGGVIGALIALPLAAIYPTIERVWLRQELPDDTVRKHEALEASVDDRTHSAAPRAEA